MLGKTGPCRIMEGMQLPVILTTLVASLAVIAGLKRVPALRRFHRVWNGLLCLCQSLLLLLLAFYGFVYIRIIVAIITHNRSFYAMPFVYTISCFLLLPLMLLLLKTVCFYLTTRPSRRYATVWYLVALAVYLPVLAVGLIVLGMSVVPTPYTHAIMIGLSAISAVFYLYTYRQFRQITG